MYAICRVNKLKNYDLGRVGAHNERRMSVPHASQNPEKINTRWTKYSPGENLNYQVKSRLDEAGIVKHRKDAVVAVEMLMTASPEYFRPDKPEAHGEYEPQLLEEWRSRTEQFLHEKYGQNLVEITLHLDEATPHIHAIIVPAITKIKSKRRTNEQILNDEAATTYESNTLDAKKMFGKFELINLQTEYAKSVEDIGLERGIHGSKAVHEAARDFYTLVNSNPKIKFKPEDILDRDVFQNLKIPLTGRDEFFKNLYKVVVKKVEKKVVGIIEKYVKQNNFLKKQLKTERERTSWFSKRFGSPEAAQAAYVDLEKKLKSVYQEKEQLAELILKTENEALSATQQLKTQLHYAEVSISRLEAANHTLEAQNKPKALKNAPFASVRRSSNDLDL